MSDVRTLLRIGAATAVVLALICALALLSAHPLETFGFYFFAALTVVSSLAIALTTDIVRTAAWLLGALCGVAGLYLLLAANFLAAIQLVVYAGGIMVLIVFGVMLTARDPRLQFTVSRREVALAGATCGVLLIGLLTVLLRAVWPMWTKSPTADATPVRAIGEALLTTYLLPFEVVSILLLAALIAAAYLARSEKTQ
ncbi:NADH-quinone oxidoreductase subunit J [Phycisphaerae bacterium RAS1]|nr:NADH-quinone oxidoreductase subunit J [Phycisphaerae bacterium RAS1]